MADTCKTRELCPNCEQADMEPYANGSKWKCPKCHYILGCCE